MKLNLRQLRPLPVVVQVRQVTPTLRSRYHPRVAFHPRQFRQHSRRRRRQRHQPRTALRVPQPKLPRLGPVASTNSWHRRTCTVNAEVGDADVPDSTEAVDAESGAAMGDSIPGTRRTALFHIDVQGVFGDQTGIGETRRHSVGGSENTHRHTSSRASGHDDLFAARHVWRYVG